MPSKQHFTFGAGALLAAALAAGCTHTLAFSDLAPIVIVGTPPAPPPPAPLPLPAAPAAPPVPAPEPKRVEVLQQQIAIHEQIQFETNQAAIKPESHSLLDEIVKVVRETPQIKSLSIEGHTDSTGNAAHNQQLSEQRAAAVHDYLLQHGISTERLSSKGWGQTRPIADNASPAGREQNRRVEFVILDQSEAPPEPSHIVAPTTHSEGSEDAPGRVPAAPSGQEGDAP